MRLELRRLSRWALVLGLSGSLAGCAAGEDSQESTGSLPGAVVGGGDVATPAPGPTTPPPQSEPACSAPALRVHDCPTSQGYTVTTYANPEPDGPEMVVFGIYESRSDHRYGYHPTGSAIVHVQRTTPHVLVLSSYEPTEWTIDAAPGARIERIILNGYHPQSVLGVPAGVPVVNRSGPNMITACAYKWPGDDQGCDTGALVSGLRQLTSRELSAFAGCYRATEFTLEDGPSRCEPPTSPPSSAPPPVHEAACTVGQGELSRYVAPSLGSPELHLLGVYESHSQHSGGYHPEGALTVDVTRRAPLILALSSYEPIHWTVKAAPGARIQRIIVNGYHAQRVTAPAGVPVENHSGADQWLGAYAYAWPSSSGGSDTPGLVSELEKRTGLSLSSFAGCYQATAFKLGE